MINRIACRDDDNACVLETLLGRAATRCPIDVTEPTIDVSLSAFLRSRSRLLSATSAASDAHAVKSVVDFLLSTSIEHDRIWARRLGWWNEEHHIPFRAGPISILTASLRAARKELLTALALVETEHRAGWQAELNQLIRQEVAVLQSPAPTETAPGSWPETWKALHAVHHRFVQWTQEQLWSEQSETQRLQQYRDIVAVIDANRWLALRIRRSQEI
jgi:hypothetical protein